jgi:uncharacterized protein YbbC (DUF1343 family)
LLRRTFQGNLQGYFNEEEGGPMSSRCIIFLSLLLLSLLSSFSLPDQSQAQTVKTGAELLDEQGFHFLQGKRFALVTNQSATVAGVQLIELMQAKGIHPAVIFTP